MAENIGRFFFALRVQRMPVDRKKLCFSLFEPLLACEKIRKKLVQELTIDIQTTVE